MSLLDTLPKPEKPGILLDFAAILKLLPHRYPFLFIDQVVSMDLDAEKPSIVCIKNVSFNEPFFQGHFPEEPVMPGVIQIETMAQAGCILANFAHEAETQGKRPAFMAVDGCRFRRPVRPGDQLTVKVVLEKFRRGIIVFTGEIYCGTELVCNTGFTATMI
jgi:3-hydroxyacyl-[acyl-carrier-protein] dehydratase